MRKTHDPLCPVQRWHRSHFQFCHCALIATVREDERRAVLEGETVQGLVLRAVAEERLKIARALQAYDFIDGDEAAQIARGET